MHTSGLSDRYDDASEIRKRKKNTPVNTPAIIMTGKRHLGGGNIALRSLPALFI